MSVRVLSVAEFQARFAEEMRAIEQSGESVTIIRSGKPIATILAAPSSNEAAKIKNWLGSGRGTLEYAEGYDPHAPAESRSKSKSKSAVSRRHRGLNKVGLA
jgi:antitoxin (DNA-binding transcriptional repressor) of toxin-antitoxin stability system